MQMKTRPKLMKMLTDCKQGKIDLVLVKSISRLSRNVTDYLSIIRDLNSRGIGLYFERENINTLKEDDEFMLSVLSSLAESELVSICENEKWSIKRRFMNGTYKQSMAPIPASFEHFQIGQLANPAIVLNGKDSNRCIIKFSSQDPLPEIIFYIAAH